MEDITAIKLALKHRGGGGEKRGRSGEKEVGGRGWGVVGEVGIKCLVKWMNWGCVVCLERENRSLNWGEGGGREGGKGGRGGWGEGGGGLSK